MKKPLEAYDIVSRTVNNRAKIDHINKILQYTAFMDPRENLTRELSVLKTTDLVGKNESKIWEIANEFIYFNEKSPKVKGRADLMVKNIRNISFGTDQLDVIFDGGSSKRHATIQFHPTKREIEMIIALQLQKIAKHIILQP